MKKSELIQRLQEIESDLPVTIVTEANGVQHEFPLGTVIEVKSYKNLETEGTLTKIVLLMEDFPGAN